MLYFRNRTKDIDVSDIEKTLNDTAQLHNKIKQKLNESKDNIYVTAKLFDQVNILHKVVSLNERLRSVVLNVLLLQSHKYHCHSQQSTRKLKNAEDNLNMSQTKMLQEEIEALKNKTEINRAQTLEAKTIADAALVNVTDANKVSVLVNNII